VRALRIFLLDLVTRHLGTKFLSLILSVVLFAFAYQSMSDEREISIVLEFTADEPLAKRYVVMTPHVELTIVVAGIRAKVEDVAQRYKQMKSHSIELSEAALDRPADARAHKPMSVPINREFLRRFGVLREGVELRREVDPPLALELEPRESIEMRLAAHPDRPGDLTLAEDSEYENPADPKDRRIEVRFNPPTVVVSGPRRYLPLSTPRPTLFVEVENVNSVLSRFQPDHTLPVATLAGEVRAFDWVRSNVGGSPELLTVQEIPAEPEAVLRQRLRITYEFQVGPKGERRQLQDVPVVLLTPPSVGGDAFLGRHEISSIGFDLTAEEVRAGRCKELRVRGPRALLGRKDVVASLQLVIDLANAESKGERTLEAPVYLLLRRPDVLGGTRAASIRQLVTIDSASPDPCRVRFRPTGP